MINYIMGFGLFLVVLAVMDGNFGVALTVFIFVVALALIWSGGRGFLGRFK